MQGDAEAKAGLPISPLMGRAGSGISKSQPGFFEVVVTPLFKALAQAFPTCRPLAAAVQVNYAGWVDQQ